MPLTGLDILVVEDQYLVAIELTSTLLGLGANVVGPMALLPENGGLDNERIDVALLDIDLRCGTSFPLVDEMTHRGVPVVLITGYEPQGLPVNYRDLPRVDKPFERDKLQSTVLRLVGRMQGMAE